jgi:carboxyl-terminal processing protease
VLKEYIGLKGNPGGLLNEAINICNLFVPKRGYSNYEIENRKHNNIWTTFEPVDTEIPLVIIITAKCVSIRNCFWALQDLDRAVIVGSRSFGKD